MKGDDWPVCCELWPGNFPNAKSLLLVVDRLRQRFDIRKVCWVADRGIPLQRHLNC
ncbi:MAG: hypothetical protein PHW74_12095 [Desulfobacca sp.]|nr:hypothetical protein [Desulfobacca sp.]